jgi:hypothetical protein
MAKSDKLIAKGENIMLLAEDDFTTNIRDIEQQLFKEINKLFDVVDVQDGKLTSSEKTIEFLNSIEKRIDEALKKSGYNSHVYEFLKNFEKIRRNNLEIHEALNKETIPYSSLNDVTRLEVANTIDKLTGAGISRDFKTPIREALYRNVILGSTIQEARQTIEDYIVSNDGKDSKLLRYAGQVARDSINQYDGSIQQVIKNQLELPDFIYSGSIIRDSRCQCIYWVKKVFLQSDELADEIDTAVKGGSLGDCKCSGMVPGTNISNFAVFRGGYNCRHRAIATKIK